MLIEAFIWARVPGDRVHHAGQVWQQAGSMVAGGDAERLTGHISLPSKKQGAGTEVVCCLQTLHAHLQGHTSPQQGCTLNLPEQSTHWDQVFTHLNLQGMF